MKMLNENEKEVVEAGESAELTEEVSVQVSDPTNDVAGFPLWWWGVGLLLAAMLGYAVWTYLKQPKRGRPRLPR